MSESKNDNESVVDSSGDVFSDLGITIDREDEMKLAFAREISRIINRGGLTQVQVAKILKTDQAKVSQIVRGKLRSFSVERLLRYMLALGFDIDVRLSRQQRVLNMTNDRIHRGRVTVQSACG